MKRLGLGLVLLCTAGCGAPQTYKGQRGDALIVDMRRAMLEHLDSRWTQSNAALQDALQIIFKRPDILLGQELGVLTLNESARRYDSNPQELLFMHTLGMINYAMLGDVDEALVEARRSDELQAWLKDQGRMRLDDPLARYLSAKLYEVRGRYDDAYIDAVRAHAAFESMTAEATAFEPSYLGTDLYRLALLSGRAEDAKRWARIYPQAVKPRAKDSAELWVMGYAGAILRDPKVMKDPDFILSEAKVTDLKSGEVSAFEPLYDFLPFAVQAQARADSAGQARGAGRVLFRTALLVGLEILAGGRIDPSGADRLFTGAMVTDKRSWDNLPAEIQALRLVLKPGRHSLRIQCKVGGTPQDYIETVELRPGKIALLRVNLTSGELNAAASPSAKP